MSRDNSQSARSSPSTEPTTGLVATLAGSVVDSHVHLLPGWLAERVREFFETHLPGDLVYPLDHGVVCDRLAAAGVGIVWSLPYAHKPGVAAGLNAASARIAAAGSGAVQIVGGATIHPADTDPLTIVRRAIDAGLRVLKLHCSVGAFDADDRRLDAAWSYVSEHGVPVVVHAGHSVDGTTSGDELGPLERVARRFPEAKIVIAHCGHRAVDRAIDLVERYPGMHADLAPVVRERVAITPARAARVATKLLFGTDAPNVARTAEQSLSDLVALGLDGDALVSVMGRTARRLIADVGR